MKVYSSCCVIKRRSKHMEKAPRTNLVGSPKIDFPSSERMNKRMKINTQNILMDR